MLTSIPPVFGDKYIKIEILLITTEIVVPMDKDGNVDELQCNNGMFGIRLKKATITPVIAQLRRTAG